MERVSSCRRRSDTGDLGCLVGLAGRQIFVGIECGSQSVTVPGVSRSGTHHLAPAAYRHAGTQSDDRWHEKRQLDRRARRQCGLAEKEDATPAEILREARYRFAIVVHGHRQMQLKALRGAALQTICFGGVHGAPVFGSGML